MLKSYCCLLRGINVSGKNKIAMAALRDMCSDLGLINVQTYIQSGNIVLSSELSGTELEEKIASAIHQTFSLTVPVLVVSQKNMLEIRQAFPFDLQDAAANPAQHLVTFLANKPRKADTEKLLSLVKSPEKLQVSNQAVYLNCPNGYGKTKLNNQFMEKHFAMSATTRNWKSLNALCDMLSAIES